jgi:hypothetical protein
MSDIPDWLVELAAQGSDDDQEEAETRDDDALDPASSESTVYMPEPDPAESVFEVSPADPTPETDDDLMGALRSQMEADELEAELAPDKPKRRISLRLPGLVPWQQFVLALLLLLDVIVIGLMFLVMLGRVSIG